MQGEFLILPTAEIELRWTFIEHLFVSVTISGAMDANTNNPQPLPLGLHVVVESDFWVFCRLVENNDGDDNDNDNNNHYLVSTYFLENSMCFAYIVINSFDNSAIKFNLFAF